MNFENKNVLIIGGTGSIGSRLLLEVFKQNPRVIRIFSRDEYKQFELMHSLGINENNPKIRFLLGDVRDKDRLTRAMNEVDIVFDLAALKHVPSCEYNPFEAVETNVIGTQNVIDAAIRNNVEKVVYTSSDKAISPTNTMGATKLLAERLIASTDYSKGKSRTVFSAVRFGNVMGTRGSVIPLFKQQILKYKHVTLTKKDMTRFMMSIGQAVDLIIKAADNSVGGEIFVLKMPVIKLEDLVHAIIDLMCEKYSINSSEVRIKEIGLRPGEKMYEELMTEQEATQATEHEGFFTIFPPHKLPVISVNPISKTKAYRADQYTPISRDEIKEILLKEDLI
ncbi:MAG: UDP-N-acetylglucosamine 4,6-dehydratase family protein [Ignavibacteriales bacterium]